MCLEYVHEVCAQCNLVLHSSFSTHSFVWWRCINFLDWCDLFKVISFADMAYGQFSVLLTQFIKRTFSYIKINTCHRQ